MARVMPDCPKEPAHVGPLEPEEDARSTRHYERLTFVYDDG